jgi:hypothetical protein
LNRGCNQRDKYGKTLVCFAWPHGKEVILDFRCPILRSSTFQLYARRIVAGLLAQQAMRRLHNVHKQRCDCLDPMRLVGSSIHTSLNSGYNFAKHPDLESDELELRS